jgi:hypothetical protein
MLKLKSNLTCSYCPKIFKDPVDLPCGDSICRRHLFERDILKQNKIKCKKCKEEFGVKNNQFKPNNTLKNLIEDQSYLNEEEMSLKQKLENTTRVLFEKYNQFLQNKTKLESEVFNHFQEIRFQIDEHRERIKERIDDIALEMINEIKKSEEMYLKNLKEVFSSFDQSQSLENELTDIEETFREPNLLIETIREMQSKQEECINDIQFKFYEMTKIKVNLMASNKFKPNSSSFNQTEGNTSLFGSIRLCQYSNTNPFDSVILKDERQSFGLIALCEFSPNDKWSLLYRGTRDGFGTNDFHSRCDGQSNTLTIFKAKESKFIFGGFTSVSWESSAIDKSKSDPNAFIFSLTNKDNRPVKMKIDPNYHHRAIYCCHKFGPVFFGGIWICNNANTTIDSFSNLGKIFPHPQYAYETNEAKTFLAGSHQFQCDEIEVFQKE